MPDRETDREREREKKRLALEQFVGQKKPDSDSRLWGLHDEGSVCYMVLMVKWINENKKI